MDEINSIEAKLKTIDYEIKRSTRQLEANKNYIDCLIDEKHRLVSIAFLKENNVKPEDIQKPENTDAGYFNDCFGFVDWIKCNSNKPWVEWNGGIFSREEFIAGNYYNPKAWTKYLEAKNGRPNLPAMRRSIRDSSEHLL